jgi:hypothetical protein
MSNWNAQAVSLLVIGLAAAALASCDLTTEPDEARRGGPGATNALYPGTTPILAVDVSHWSGFVTAGQVACWSGAGVEHVVVGQQNADISAQQLQVAVNGGMTVDAYVVLDWYSDITSQVNRALSQIAPYPVQRLWLDVERPPGSFSATQLRAKVQQGVDACGSFPCGIYTRKVWWRDNMANTDAFAQLPIWYAYYDGDADFNDWYSPRVWYEGPFGGWTDPTGKQYDSDWTAPDLCGVSVDYNLMYTQPGGPPFTIETGQVTVQQPSAAYWHSVSLSNSYQQPVVILQPLSFNGGQPGTIRLRNVTATSFEFQIDEWDYLDGAHVTETIGYLVAEAGAHRLDDGRWFEAGRLETNHVFTTVNFAAPFAAPPVILSQAQTYRDAQAVVTRQRSASASGFAVRLQEEEANDGVHAVEEIGYIAVEAGPGSMQGTSFEAATSANAVTSAWHSLGFLQAYEGPVFLAAMQTYDGGNTAALRYRNLTTTGVEVRVEEEASLDPEVAHTTEAVGYLVFEGGSEPPPPPDDGRPPAPAGLEPADDAVITSSSVTLSCDAIAGVSGYEFTIEYESAGVWRTYYTYSSTDNSQTFWPVYDDTRYRWRVRAENSFGWGDWSAWATFNFGDVSSGTVPPAPLGLDPNGGVTITGSSVTMSCDAISGVSGYEFAIEYLSGGVWRTYYTYGSSVNSKTFWPSVASTDYRWRARAQNDVGWGAWSNWATFRFAP